MLFVIILLVLLWISSSFEQKPTESTIYKNSYSEWNTPTFCINKKFHALILNRFPDISEKLLISESHYLHQSSATEYFRSFDILAYNYFVLSPNNPYRQESCDNAKYEYIPLLPFYWRPYPGYASGANISAAVMDIINFIENDDKSTNIRFTVISAYNFRTLLGTGMPTQIRKGYAWNTVMNFVMSMSIGHYERYPQCPDLLRKSWKYIIELPYVTINHHMGVSDSSEYAHLESTLDIFFAGRFDLIGPEIVCSTRYAISSLASLPKTMIINITSPETRSKVKMDIMQHMRRSKFCIITKADSYSSSSLYHAIQALCIPIVISDWFVFSFPWLIPYDDFIIRIAEQDFIKNPIFVINSVLKVYSSNRRLDMIAEMQKWRDMLSYSSLRSDGLTYQNVKSLLLSQHVKISDSINDYSSKLGDSVIKSKLAMTLSSSYIPHHASIPFELMLQELHLVNSNRSKVLPCISPFECTPHGKSIYSYGMKFAKDEIPESRSHLCQHNSRLIGHYKLVYFMQCVRVLWPLQPGKLKPLDTPKASDVATGTGLMKLEYKFVMDFHNLTDEAKSQQWTYPTIYPPIQPSIQKLILPFAKLK